MIFKTDEQSVVVRVEESSYDDIRKTFHHFGLNKQLQKIKKIK